MNKFLIFCFILPLAFVDVKAGIFQDLTNPIESLENILLQTDLKLVNQSFQKIINGLSACSTNDVQCIENLISNTLNSTQSALESVLESVPIVGNLRKQQQAFKKVFIPLVRNLFNDSLENIIRDSQSKCFTSDDKGAKIRDCIREVVVEQSKRFREGLEKAYEDAAAEVNLNL